jgi:hypothetical protein
LRELAFSKASAAPGENFVPFGPDELESLAPLLKSFRATLTAESCTDAVMLRAAWQTSEDGVSWSDGAPPNPWSAFGQTLSGVGAGPKTTTSDWQTSLGTVKRFIRFGVVAGQSGVVGTLQQGLVTLTLDLESRS